MQTSLQQLREDITLSVLLSESTKTIVCAFIDNHLEREKEQIAIAWSDHKYNKLGNENTIVDGKDYYNTTFEKQ